MPVTLNLRPGKKRGEGENGKGKLYGQAFASFSHCLLTKKRQERPIRLQKKGGMKRSLSRPSRRRLLHQIAFVKKNRKKIKDLMKKRGEGLG